MRAWVCAVVVAAVMAATVGAAAQEAVTADLASTATLVGAGEAATIDVTVTCPKRYQVLEAFVYITQDDRTSQFAGIPIRKCKDRPTTYTITVRAFDDAPFHRGEATATSYVLVTTSDQSSTISGGEGQAITIL